MRLVFLGSPPFALPILAALLESDHELALLVTPPDRPRGRGRALSPSPLARLAQAGGVDCLRPQSTRDPEFLPALAAREPELLVVASFGEILRQPVLELAPRGALNVHASLLPRWRGAAPVQHAILAGDRETGVTIQRMVLALDAGDVLLAEATPIGTRETAGELQERLARIGSTLLLRALGALQAGTATFTPQDASRVTLAPKLDKADGRIDWSRPSDEVDRHVRAMTPWPGATTTWSGPRGERALSIGRARPAALPATDAPGTLLARDGGLFVCCGRGMLELLELKPAGRPQMGAEDFLRGARLGSSDRFV